MPGRWALWRSPAPGWLAAVVILVVGLPLFLRMPLWIDVTLYDVAARTVLRGGVHYRDVFDTNPPGFVWALCAVRALLGPSMEAVRAVDLAVVGAVTVLLLRWARTGGATAAGVAWTAAGAAGFYLFLSEFNHAQRDVWMMLPAVAAASYRLARTGRVQESAPTNGWVFRTALLEGVVWGLAAWVKPHVVLIAAVAWLVVQGRMAGSAAGFGPRLRRGAADMFGSLFGGLLVGAAGVAWLIGTGAWGSFLDVFTNWNTSYLGQILREYEDRLDLQLGYFPPWSLLALVAVPLALLNLIDARPWAARDRGEFGPLGRVLPGWLHDRWASADARFARGLLAAVYLAWAAVALGLQKQYHYVHVPETLLALALFAANRWAVVVPVLLLQAGVVAWLAVAPSPPKWEEQSVAFRHAVWQYPDRDPNRLKWWVACFAREVPGEVRNGVAFQSDFFAGIDWAELAEVEAYLREQGVTDGGVMCWHDSPHALYLTMNLRPPIRFMHLSTAAGMGEWQYQRVKAEVTDAAPGVRFVVSDLKRVALFYPPEMQARMAEPGPGPDLLPPVVPAECRRVFPMNQPTVFRSGNGRGRYVVHVLVNPVGEVFVPHWPG